MKIFFMDAIRAIKVFWGDKKTMESVAQLGRWLSRLKKSYDLIHRILFLIELISCLMN